MIARRVSQSAVTDGPPPPGRRGATGAGAAGQAAPSPLAIAVLAGAIREGDLSAELGAGVVSRLAALEAASRGLRAPGELARIRADLLAVVGMWRELLVVHAPVGTPGRCPRCRGWWGRRRGPCRVWTAAHTVLVALESPAGAAGSVPFGGIERPLTLRAGAPAGLTIVPRADGARARQRQLARFDNLAALLLGVQGMGLTVEDLVRMVGDPQFSAQVSATFGGLVRAQRDHGGAGTETATDPGNGPGP